MDWWNFDWWCLKLLLCFIIFDRKVLETRNQKCQMKVIFLNSSELSYLMAWVNNGDSNVFRIFSNLQILSANLQINLYTLQRKGLFRTQKFYWQQQYLNQFKIEYIVENHEYIFMLTKLAHEEFCFIAIIKKSNKFLVFQ